jgi:apolipoprotein N-acyltransferase
LGGNAVTGWKRDGPARVGTEIRNSAYYFQPAETPEQRYDKIRLVAFSERAPFVSGPPWLRRAGLAIAAGRAVQPLTAGNLETFEPFELVWRRGDADGAEERLRFISPICLEAVDPRVIAAMMQAPTSDGKSVDMIANLSSDGWFAVQEKHLHWQSVVFRAIEHRVPLVRASNTGISGWIDSLGRVRDVAAPDASGAILAPIELDDRATPYAKYGDVFAGMCLGLAVLAIAVQCGLSARRRLPGG